MADLRHQKEDAERELARLQREADQLPLPDYARPAYVHGDSRYGARANGRGRDTTVMPGHYGDPEVADDEGLFAYDAPADADAAYADAAYADSAYADAAYGDGAYGDGAYADRPLEEEPFEDEAFADERTGTGDFGDEGYGIDASGGEAFGSYASGAEAFRDEAADPVYPEPVSEDPATAATTGDGEEPSRDGRTEGLVSRGRWSAQSPWLSRKRLIMMGTPAGLLLILILILVLSGSGASWPASVTTVQNEITKACQNGDVASEPGQVNFACGKATRQVLWVFSLLTSNDNPHFNDLKTGRVGLEPITPSRGRRGGLVAEPAPPVLRGRPDRQPGSGGPSDQQHRGRRHPDRDRWPLGGPAGAGEQLGQLPALHRIGPAARPQGLPQRVRPGRSPVRRARPPWSPTSTRSGSSGPGRARPRTPRCCSRTTTTPATRRCRRCSGSSTHSPG